MAKSFTFKIDYLKHLEFNWSSNFIRYSGDLKSGHVQISNGQSLSSFRMVRNLNGPFSLNCFCGNLVPTKGMSQRDYKLVPFC